MKVQKKVKNAEIKSEPLKEKWQIELVRNLIETRTKEPLRNRIIFNLGINNGLRTGDILNLKIKDVWDKDYAQIIEGKTGKRREIRLDVANIKDDIKEYVGKRKWNDNTYLFTSYKEPNKPIETIAIYRMFKRLNKYSGGALPYLTAHSMRRTFGYWYYKQTKDIVTLMKIFNHSNQSITLRYIGIEREEIRESLRDFVL